MNTCNMHLASGKWSVHIDTMTGQGEFFGPRCQRGAVEIIGKVVCRASCWLPRQVIDALNAAGFDCGSTVVG